MRVIVHISPLLAVAAFCLSAAGQEPPGRADPATRPSLLEPIEPAEPRLIAPADAGEPAPAPPARKLGEGQAVLNLVGRPEPDDSGRWLMIEHPEAGPLRLLPCELLEALEDALTEDEDARVRVSGDVYRFQNRDYLLLRRAAILRPPEEPPEPEGPAEPAEMPTTAPATAPAEADAPSEPAGRSDGEQATADDVGAELLGEVPTVPVIPERRPRRPQPRAPSVAAPTAEPVDSGPGRMIVNRRVRLMPAGEDGWFRIAFEADNTLREPPLRVLPNAQLGRLVAASNAGKAAGAEFAVSGEVHRYRGRSYVLLRSVLRRREMGQF